MSGKPRTIPLKLSAIIVALMLAWTMFASTASPVTSHACLLYCARPPTTEEGSSGVYPWEHSTQQKKHGGYNSSVSITPQEITIPVIGVAASIIPAGVNAQGNMDAPRNVSDVSWYQWGAAPGELGSAVLAGHVDNAAGLRGVFKYVHTLDPGDEISVTRNDGTVQRFVVSEIATYPRSQVPRERLFNQKDAARLNLITCGGSWDAVQRTYTHRVVVYAIAASEIGTISANDGGLSRPYDVPARGR